MTSKEFEVMRNAQKHETDLAVLRELDSIRAEIIVNGNSDINTQTIIGILDKHIKEYEE